MRIALASLTVLCIAAPAFAAPPTLDSLLCRAQTQWDDHEPYAGLTGTTSQLMMDGNDDVASPDGTMKLVAAPQDAKTNRGTLLVQSKDGKTLHKLAPLDADYGCGTGRWLTNDVVLVSGSYCMEFGAKPYFANAKTGKQLAAFGAKGFDADPETIVHAVAVDGTTWAFATYNHTSKVAMAFTTDIATGKVGKKIDVTAAMVQKLPACSK